jgi:hypothetical protein
MLDFYLHLINLGCLDISLEALDGLLLGLDDIIELLDLFF